MRRSGVLAALGAALLSFGSGAVRAAEEEQPPSEVRGIFTAFLRGANEVPAVSSTGKAVFAARLNAAGDTLMFVLRYADLEGTVSVAHVHFGQPGVNGGVMYFLCGGGSKPACPPAPATITGTVVAADIVGPAGQGIAAGEFAEALAAMRAGLAYANVHSSKHPTGEVRGPVR
jgi:hypothetical protein